MSEQPVIDTNTAHCPAPDEIGRIMGLTLNVPDWFEDPEFVNWLNDHGNLVFSWHQKGDVPGDFSDTIISLEPNCEGEGSASDMPRRFWQALLDLCREHLGIDKSNYHYFVRLTNLR
jgi:hypothetical protein